MTIAIAHPLTLSSSEARAITDQIKEHTDAVWKLLVVAHEGSAWKPLGYATWADYVEGEFNMSRAYSYRVLDQARVIRAIEDAVSPYGDISPAITEKQARDIKPVLAAVVEDVKVAVEDLGPDAIEQDVQDAIDAAVETHRPVTKVTDTRKEESFWDAGTGEQVAPVNLPPAPKPLTSVRQQNAEQAALEFSRSVLALVRATTPEGRQVLINAWGLGAEASTPHAREHVTPSWFRTIARGLNALANQWES